jgi:hypothetical protein
VFVGTLLLASVRQSFQFKLFGCKRLRHLHRAIDVAAEIWNHSIALHRRYFGPMAGLWPPVGGAPLAIIKRYIEGQKNR